MDIDSFLAFVNSRRSVRQYTTERVSRADIERLIEAASWAPSSHNRQGWKFIVFDNKHDIQRLAEEVRRTLRESLAETNRHVAGHAEELIHYAGIFDRAPAVILVLHKKPPKVARPLLDCATHELASGEAISAAMACQNLLLAAHAMGLGACIMTAPLIAGAVWRALRDLPFGFEPTCLVTIGTPAEKPAKPRRKKLDHILEYR